MVGNSDLRGGSGPSLSAEIQSRLSAPDEGIHRAVSNRRAGYSDGRTHADAPRSPNLTTCFAFSRSVHRLPSAGGWIMRTAIFIKSLPACIFLANALKC